MIVIIGGGPAGLSAASHLEQPHCLIEAEASLGGLCRSFKVAGATFDYGGHAFFTKNVEARAVVEKSHGGPLYTQPRNAKVYWRGHWLDYPFQANLHGLPTEVIAECLEGLFAASKPLEKQKSSEKRD